MLISQAVRMAESGLVPRNLIRVGCRALSWERYRELEATHKREPNFAQAFVESLKQFEVANSVEEANEQHYEVPTEFFKLILGPKLKYSCLYWGEGVDDLDQAENESVELTLKHADIQDGQKILDLGCGWGSVSLEIARRYPNCTVTSVSNSETQHAYFDGVIARESLKNIQHIKADVAKLQLDKQFDRIISVEMFEHIANYSEAFRKLAMWSHGETRVFLHIFNHRKYAYRFLVDGPGAWMARHFFTGGTMPSRDLFMQVQSEYNLVESWDWSGVHYEKTLNAWLGQMDTYRDEILEIFEAHYGKGQGKVWWQRWCLFLIGSAECFGYNKGRTWGVTHYLFIPSAVKHRRLGR